MKKSAAITFFGAVGLFFMDIGLATYFGSFTLFMLLVGGECLTVAFLFYLFWQLLYEHRYSK